MPVSPVPPGFREVTIRLPPGESCDLTHIFLNTTVLMKRTPSKNIFEKGYEVISSVKIDSETIKDLLSVQSNEQPIQRSLQRKRAVAIAALFVACVTFAILAGVGDTLTEKLVFGGASVVSFLGMAHLIKQMNKPSLFRQKFEEFRRQDQEKDKAYHDFVETFAFLHKLNNHQKQAIARDGQFLEFYYNVGNAVVISQGWFANHPKPFSSFPENLKQADEQGRFFGEAMYLEDQIKRRYVSQKPHAPASLAVRDFKKISAIKR